MEGGDKFTYSNKFGGTWYWDDEDPFNNNAQAQTYTPPLNESFKYGEDKIFGVNIGGWLVPEPFIAPSLYEPYVNNTTPAVDEWTLCENMRNSDGGIDLLEEHYKTFITEKDFAEIAGAGLNHVRIPIGYYAIETRGDEPFLAKTSWKYFLKAINWARKYGLRINLDLHVLPGSQNGWNHSGRLGDINMLLGPMGLANAQRSLDYIRIIAEFISQDQYKDVITMFGVTNEPRGPMIGQDQLESYYYQAYQIVREASGTGEGKGPYISLHDGFMGLPQWEGFMEGADRVQLDWHPYIAFNDQSDAPMSSYAGRPCDTWGKPINQSMSAFGITAAGEFSNGVTDCGWWLNGVEDGVRYEGTYKEGNFPRVGSCDDWINYDTWDDDMKASVKQFAMESMDAMQNWFFWTWKIGESKTLGKVGSPAWSYSLGLDQGWMPTDPRTAYGSCGNPAPWDGELKAWQTGGSGAGSLASTVAWPPSTISHGGAPDELPTYTPTGSLVTLPGPTFTSAPSVKVGSGWNNNDDQTGMMTDAAGCSYLDPWVGTTAAPPSPLCTS
ncbi:glycoside hydrolase family 5 protein [Schizophyllum commune H4-8]|uniref:glucan 1,3-beta-glucosidase n=1 Tax=Schizophyllum commune (strain H4-8 / FGSC 9210) TaxID=578458 RepID=D8PVQ7_SCHCM|nr:glycoside hydrolase family 5 protein [Schizophyllum commune H4-8]KAI5900255.1 glycoside hydrolase family 5 protein [Schizophyllum commune H4-8]